MFTIRPAKKNSAERSVSGGNGNGENGNGNGHKNGNGNGNGGASSGHAVTGNGNGNGNGHAPVLSNGHKTGILAGNGNGNGHSKHIETVLGPGIHYKGTFSGAGGVRIEGGFDGTITLTGSLVIAEGAKVTAEINADAVSVAGHVKGNITAKKVEILATGRVWGDLVTGAFATEEGAFLRGQITMQDDVPAPTPKAEEKAPEAVEAKVEEPQKA